MKKVLSYLLILILFVQIAPFSVYAESSQEKPTVYIDTDTYCMSGGTITVDVCIDNNPGFISTDFTVDFDSKLTLIGATNGEAFAPIKDSQTGGVLIEGLTYVPPAGLNNNGQIDSACHFLWYANTIDDRNIKNGTIVTLVFKVDEDINAYDKLNISVQSLSSNNIDKFRETYDLSDNISITVLDYMPGDINSDNRLNVFDIVPLAQYISDGCQTIPNSYNVTLNETAADITGDGKINVFDLVFLSQYVADGCQTLEDSYNVKLTFCEPKCAHTDMTATEAKDATCTENGNIAYWHCEDCDKYFLDADGKTETTLEDTVTSSLGHSYSDKWSYDSQYHWHDSTCGHGEEVDGYQEHDFVNDKCTVCLYVEDTTVQLAAPVISRVAYDTVYWNSVNNSKTQTYTVIVDTNGTRYSYISEINECSLKNVTDRAGNHITVPGTISVMVYANDNGDFLESEYSDTYTGYYYVPEKDSSSVGNSHKIGYGYNFIEDPYYDDSNIGVMDVPVFNFGKLISVGKFTADGEGKGYVRTHSFSSIDEYMSKSESDAKETLGAGVPLIANIKENITKHMEESYSTYRYNHTYIVESATSFKDYYIGEWKEKDVWKYCLNDPFLKDIRGESPDTLGMDNASLAEYIYDKYGTHAVLGVITGGKYSANYVISTNKENMADKVKTVFDVEGGGTLSEIVNLSANAGLTIAEEGTVKYEDTETNLEITWTGSTSGGTSSLNGIDSAIASWQSGITENTAVSVGITKDGGIPISSLLDENPALQAEFDKLIEDKTNAEYEKFVEMYSYDGADDNLPMSVSYTDSQYVLTVDVSKYQSAGSLGDAYNPNLVDGVLTIHPTMSGKRIGKIVINGGFNDYPVLLNDFSVVLPKTWNRDVDVVVRNVGVSLANDSDFIDTSAITKNIVNIEYEGINAIKGYDGIVEIYSLINGNENNFRLSLTADEALVLSDSGIYDGKLCLPVAEKKYKDFAGWYTDTEGNGTNVSDNLGNVSDSFAASASITTVYPKWNNATYKLTLKNENATDTTGVPEVIYQQSYVGIFSDDDCNEASRLATVSIPKRTGYKFLGYYKKVENNATVQAKGTDQCIDENGNVVMTQYSYAAFSENGNIYALWTPAVYDIQLQNEGATIGTIYARYKDAYYSDKACTTKITTLPSSIVLPTKDGHTFGGFSSNGASADIVDSNGKISNDAPLFTSAAKVQIVWVKGAYIINLNYGDGVTNVAEATKVYYYSLSKKKYYADSDLSREITNIVIPVKKGYTFGGYSEEVHVNVIGPSPSTGNGLKEITYVNSEGKIVSGDISSSTTVSAKWTAKTTTVKFNSNSSSIKVTPTTISTTQTVTYDSSGITFPVPTAGKYYTFAGWYTAASGGTKVTGADGKVIGKWSYSDDPTMTLYARWNQTYPEYTYISTVSDLSNIRNATGKNYMLIADISNVGSWTTIPSFSGILDGDGHTISGMVYSFSNGSDIDSGMFNTISSGGIVNNLKVSGCKATYTPSSEENAVYEVKFGFVAAYNRGTISNCTFTSNTINIDGNSKASSQYLYTGIAVCENYGTISGSTSTGNIINLDADTVNDNSADDKDAVAVAGGICSYNMSGGKVTGCTAKTNTITNRICYLADEGQTWVVVSGGMIGFQQGTQSGNTASGNTVSAIKREYIVDWGNFPWNSDEFVIKFSKEYSSDNYGQLYGRT